jgi:hypothetical protein
LNTYSNTVPDDLEANAWRRWCMHNTFSVTTGLKAFFNLKNVSDIQVPTDFWILQLKVKTI